MGGKESKAFPITIEEANKRGKKMGPMTKNGTKMLTKNLTKNGQLKCDGE